MQKHRLAAFLIAGILLGLPLSACGVAVGQAQFVGSPAVLSQKSTSFSLPSLLGDTVSVAPSPHSMALTNPLSALTLADHAGGCNGDGGYYDRAFNTSDD
jgi:hypothetical protein